MTALMDMESELAPIREDLGVLKRDVATLIEHMKGGTTNTVHNAARHIGRRVQRLRQDAGAEGLRSAEAFNHFMETQPLVALSIAVGIGYVGGRVLRR